MENRQWQVPSLRKLFADSAYRGPVSVGGLPPCCRTSQSILLSVLPRPKPSLCYPNAGLSSTLGWLNRGRRLAKAWGNLNLVALAFLRLPSIRPCSKNFVILHELFGHTLRTFRSHSSQLHLDCLGENIIARLGLGGPWPHIDHSAFGNLEDVAICRRSARTVVGVY